MPPTSVRLAQPAAASHTVDTPQPTLPQHADGIEPDLDYKQWDRFLVLYLLSDQTHRGIHVKWAKQLIGLVQAWQYRCQNGCLPPATQRIRIIPRPATRTFLMDQRNSKHEARTWGVGYINQLALGGMPLAELKSILDLAGINTRMLITILLDFSAIAGNIYECEDLLGALLKAPANASNGISQGNNGISLLQQMLGAPSSGNPGSSSPVEYIYPCGTSRSRGAGSLQVYVQSGRVWRFPQGADLTYFVENRAEYNIHMRLHMWIASRMWKTEHKEFEFREVLSKEESRFTVAFKADLVDAYAEAFFPGAATPARILKVGPLSFEPDNIGYLCNILSHELGHVLGLRHEFWDKNWDEWKSNGAGFPDINVRDKASVMNNRHVPELWKLVVDRRDLGEAKKFYTLPVGSEIQGYQYHPHRGKRGRLIPTTFILHECAL